MSRYRGPKNRLARREGTDLGLKTVGTKSHASLLRRLNIPPGQHGPKGRRKLSDYGLQLREKQKARRIYGVLEKQFRNYYQEALKVKGNTGETLLVQLERRLDNVIYRLGFAPTRSAARQYVSHGHIRVNNQKINFPSYQVRIGEVITLTDKARNIPVVKKLLSDEKPVIPSWLERKAAVGKVVRLPKREDIDADINEQLIVEYYSR